MPRNRPAVGLLVGQSNKSHKNNTSSTLGVQMLWLFHQNILKACSLPPQLVPFYTHWLWNPCEQALSHRDQLAESSCKSWFPASFPCCLCHQNPAKFLLRLCLFQECPNLSLCSTLGPLWNRIFILHPYPQIHTLKQCGRIRLRWGLWEVITSWRHSLLQRTPIGLPAPFPLCEHTVPSMIQKCDFIEHTIFEHLGLGLYAFRTMRKECVLFRSYFNSYILFPVMPTDYELQR